MTAFVRFNDKFQTNDQFVLTLVLPVPSTMPSIKRLYGNYLLNE